jgi:hypothetical protein
LNEDQPYFQGSINIKAISSIEMNSLDKMIEGQKKNNEQEFRRSKKKFVVIARKKN